MKQSASTKILAIETSCDDTCIAIFEIRNSKFEILSNVISSQVKLHSKYGGVYPTLAKREHQRNLISVLSRALKKASLLKNPKSKILISKPKIAEQSSLRGRQILNSKSQILNSILEREPELLKQTLSFLKKHRKPNIDAIALTVGPGLEPCLWVGVNFAKALSCFWDLPIVRVNHIEAHIFANFVGSNSKFKIQNSKLFPAICLVVSGGHTQLILMRGLGRYKILGETRDDAAGECFDKAARILGLGYPGGPIVAKMATKIKNPRSRASSLRGRQKSKIKNIKLPRPMIYQKNYDFSFSGLKTAVLYQYQKSKIKNLPQPIPTAHAQGRNSIWQKYKQEMCYEVQQAIIDVLIHKTLKAAKDFKVKTIILGGGVAANSELRKQFKSNIQHLSPNIQYLIPNIQFCTDNAVMVGVAGYFHWLQGESACWEKIRAEANLRIK